MQSNAIFGFLLVGFMLFIVRRDELRAYMGFIFG